MKELNILHFCLSRRWGSLERLLIRNCDAIGELGHRNYFYGVKNSVLDQQIKSDQIIKKDYGAALRLNLTDLLRARGIRRLVTENRIDLVICYNFFSIRVLALALESKPQVGLICCAHDQNQAWRPRLFLRFLLRRVDHIIHIFRSERMRLSSFWNFKDRQLTAIGFGISPAEHENDQHEQELSDFFKIGVYFDSDDKEMTPLVQLLEVVKNLWDRRDHLTENFMWKLTSRPLVIVYSQDLTNQSMNKTKKVVDLLKESSLDEFVTFASTHDGLFRPQEIDVWMELAGRDSISDASIYALIEGLPVILPRMYESIEIFESYPECGEEFKKNDAHGIREAILKIANNYARYLQKVALLNDKIVAQLGPLNHRQQLAEALSDAMEKRFPH